MKTMNNYMKAFVSRIGNSGTYLNQGNGAFIHSCHTHCEGQSDNWFRFTINGVTMRDAVGKWWRGGDDSKAEDNNYLPCYYNENGTPRECNPTCGAAGYERLFVTLSE